MWTVLFPNLKHYKIISLEPSAKEVLEKIFSTAFTLKLIKRCPSHLLLTLTFLSEKSPSLCLKLYHPRLFKKNRPKIFLKTLYLLKKLNIPLLSPLLIFYLSPFKAFFWKNPFTGGIISPFISQGFLKAEEFKEDAKRGFPLLYKLIQFIFQLHEKGVLLKDTKYNNFFYQKDKGFRIFDLEGVKVFKRTLSLSERLKDLAPLAMSLEWIGLQQSSFFIFKTYQSLFAPLTSKYFQIYQNYINNTLSKRLKKFNHSLCKKDNNSCF